MTTPNVSRAMVEHIRDLVWSVTGCSENLAEHAASAILESLSLEATEGWQPIESAPRDGTPILVRLLPDLTTLEPERTDLERWNGVTAVMRNRDDVADWCFAAPVGQGGFPDKWMIGWRPLPAPPDNKDALAVTNDGD